MIRKMILSRGQLLRMLKYVGRENGTATCGVFEVEVELAGDSAQMKTDSNNPDDNPLNTLRREQAKLKAPHCHHDKTGKCPYAYVGKINGGIPAAACKLPYDKPCPEVAKPVGKCGKVKFDPSHGDWLLIEKIATRAMTIPTPWKVKKIDFLMDIEATHRNGCPLKLAELLAAKDFDFSHDVFGIRTHLNRTTGKLKNCFLPRFAK